MIIIDLLHNLSQPYRNNMAGLFCISLALFLGSMTHAWVCPPTRFNVLDFGAVGDGKTMNTQAFARCVAAASASHGGRVYVNGSGAVYLTGTIVLQSNTCLEVETGTTVYASDSASDFLHAPSLTWDTGTVNLPLIFAVNVSHVGLIGGGVISGGANDPPGHLVKSYDPATNFLTPALLKDCSESWCRSKLAIFRDAQGVRLEGITLANSHSWTLSFERCLDVAVVGTHIRGDRRWPNNDGMDIIGFDLYCSMFCSGIVMSTVR